VATDGKSNRNRLARSPRFRAAPGSTCSVCGGEIVGWEDFPSPSRRPKRKMTTKAPGRTHALGMMLKLRNADGPTKARELVFGSAFEELSWHIQGQSGDFQDLIVKAQIGAIHYPVLSSKGNELRSPLDKSSPRRTSREPVVSTKPGSAVVF
jgi:hypothetical protein